MSTTLARGKYIPLTEYARRKGIPYARLYTAIRQGRSTIPHYQVGRAHLVKVG